MGTEGFAVIVIRGVMYHLSQCKKEELYKEWSVKF